MTTAQQNLAASGAGDPSVLTTRLEALRRWVEQGSLWPLPFGTACCAIEFMAVASPRYDIARFGAEVLRFSPRQSDVLMVMGTITDKMVPVLKEIYDQMAEPKWVICMGACATSGGFYRSYHVQQGIDEAIPVDVYIPGCPPTPEAVLQAIIRLEEEIKHGPPHHGAASRDGAARLHQPLWDASVTTLDPPSQLLVSVSQHRDQVDQPLAERLRQQFGHAILASSDFRGDLSLTLRRDSLLPLCQVLRDDPELRFDLLLDVCGVDYLDRSERFDVVYHLTSLETGHRLRLKVPLTEAQPEVESVTSIWKGANWFEREAYDLYGIRFRNHPDLRRILTHDGFGDLHPMRRDYPPGLRQPFERHATLPIAERSPAGDEPAFEVDEHPMILNIGPSHPAMHGAFRVVARLDGEVITDADVELGYLHRQFEKMAETHTYWQVIPYCDRLNYCSSFCNSSGYAMAVEKLLGITIPKRAQYIRVILNELSRIMDHAVCIGANMVDMGLLSDFFYLWTLREEIYDLLEECSGARMMVSYVRIGGLAEDVPREFAERVRTILKSLPRVVDETDRLITHNGIARERMRGIGAISAEDALAYGWTGPCLRAAGVPYDVRKAHPYYDYDQFEFAVPVGSNGDTFDRYLVRLEEMRQSGRIVEQALDNLPDGPVIIDDWRIALPPKNQVYTNIEALMAHFKLIMEGIRPPVGEVYGYSEAANGELGFYIVSDGTGRPYRIKVRPPCFAVYQAFPQMLRDMMVSDVIAAIGSLNIIAGELDR
jgi:NADH dehydrogenase I D subunit